MNIKKAINNFKDIIALLERDEKKEAIAYLSCMKNNPHDCIYGGFNDILNVLEQYESQGHFSKRINRIIEVEVEASNMEVIDELAKDISDMANGQSYRKGKIGVVSTRWVRD